MNHASRTGAKRKPQSDMGWRDYRAGAPFPRDYDLWPRIEQRNYENGRLRAANYKVAFGILPPKQASVARCAQVADLIGIAVPNGRS